MIYARIMSCLLIMTAIGCTPGAHHMAPDAAVAFNWFEYQGNDDAFHAPLEEGQFLNPILAGFYPDPSITRAGNYFYLVHSSFSWSPGVPLFRSQDLVNWESLGYILTTAEQLPLQNQQVSRGIYAPTIRYHDGVFYLITTLVDVRGNFIVTATDPAGPWSEPILLPEVGGIDPDIFFDDDGKVYIAHNDAPVGEPLYEGHRAIWLWEFDLAAKKIIPDSGRVIVNGGVDLAKQPIWIEAPHIFKKDGWYYLTCAEGGTGYNHSQVIFRTRHLHEPFVPFERNPILTQRDLDIDRPNPITTAGHADFIQTENGEWWAVFLATRAYDKTFYNTGRETFLLPVRWEDEWPIILDAGQEIPYRVNAPRISTARKIFAPLTGNFRWRDNFDQSELHHHWNFLRSNNADWHRLSKNQLVIDARSISLASLEQPAFIARRQQHMRYTASTELNLPQHPGLSAGLVAFQNETAHYYLGVKRIEDGYKLFIEQAKQAQPTIIKSVHIANQDTQQTMILGIEGDKGEISFYYQTPKGPKIFLARALDGKLLSTEVAGGFVGTYLGMHVRNEPASTSREQNGD